MKSKIIKAINSGVLATAVMTIMMFMAPAMGMPEMPIGEMLANFLNIPLAAGWVLHFTIGIILAAIYIYLIKSRIIANKILKGAIFSLIPFFVAQIVVMPMMGPGLFCSNSTAPLLMVLGSLIGHLVYGTVLGVASK